MQPQHQFGTQRASSGREESLLRFVSMAMEAAYTASTLLEPMSDYGRRWMCPA